MGVYPYLNVDEKECSHICNGVISLDGTICYKSKDECPENTESKEINGKQQCFCKYKYYY